jgi:tetratricopeptide (TPR) repeat protein
MYISGDKSKGDQRIMRNSCKLLAIFVVLFISALQTVSAQMDVKQIQGLIAEAKFDQALAETKAILAKDPENVQALFMKGLIHTRTNQLKEAEETFLFLSKNNPDLPEPYNNLAVIYASQGEFEKAREALQKAINTHPSYATAHENIGDIYAKMASQAYNQALELDNSNIAAREKLSLINELFSVPASASPAPTVIAEAKPPEVIESKPSAPPPAPKPAPAPAVEPAPEPQPEPAVIPPTLAVAEPEPEPAPAPEPTPAPAVEPKPVPAPKELQPHQINQLIINNVNSWARAWSSKDVNGYLSFYAADYSPPELGRAAWLEQRKDRISGPRFIKVEVFDLEVIMHGTEHAQATFLQKYTSDTYSDSVNKTLLFRRFNDRWLIVQEKSE